MELRHRLTCPDDTIQVLRATGHVACGKEIMINYIEIGQPQNKRALELGEGYVHAR